MIKELYGAMRYISRINKNMKVFSVAMAIAAFSPLSAAHAYQQQVNQLSFELADQIRKVGKTKIAVVDFVDLRGNVTELGRFLAEEISTELVTSRKGFSVIDRANLRFLIKEAKFRNSGLVDPKNVKRLGRIAGVDAIIVGTVTPLGDQVRVIAKVMDVETARIIAAGAIRIAKTKAIDNLLSRGIAAESSRRDKVEPTVRGGRPDARSRVSKRLSYENKVFRFSALRARSRNGFVVTYQFFNKTDNRLWVRLHNQSNDAAWVSNDNDERCLYNGYDDKKNNAVVLGIRPRNSMAIDPKQSTRGSILFKKCRLSGKVANFSMRLRISDSDANYGQVYFVQIVDIPVK